jgi:hypothetical protein
MRSVTLAGGILLGAALLVLAAMLLHGFGENGFRAGSRAAWRYAAVIFFAVLAAGPLCRIAARLFPVLPMPEGVSRAMVWGFAASYGVYLLSVFGPGVIALSRGAFLMIVMGGGIALAMAIAAVPLKCSGLWLTITSRIRRAVLTGGAVYFWLCYSVMALARISGPHRPDIWYGFSLCLMVAGLLLRYADHWLVQDRRGRRDGVLKFPAP